MVLPDIISVAFLEKLTNTVHFFSFLEFCNYMQYIHDICHQPVNQIN